MKKNYSTPSLVSMKINAASILVGSKEVTSVDGGDTNISFWGGGSGGARSRDFWGYDLEEDLEIEDDK